MLIHVVNKKIEKIKNLETVPIKLNCNAVPDGLYLYDLERNSLKSLNLDLEADYLLAVQAAKKDCIRKSSKYKYEVFDFKWPAKRFYELGDQKIAELAYEIIEFECSEEEAAKYKGYIISFENNLAKAYRYKLSKMYVNGVPQLQI